MKSENILNDLIRISSEIDFFDNLYKYGFLDTSNEFFIEMDSLAVKINVILYKNKWDDTDLDKIYKLYEQFHLLLFQLYFKLTKGVIL